MGNCEEMKTIQSTSVFGFVILHYLVADATIDCVESIRMHCKNDNYHIVIVDNNSANGSLEKLEQRYANMREIHILHNIVNDGFARGNNVGYEYCKNNLKCNYIAVLNNDIVLLSDNFIAQSEDDYIMHGYGVIGPDIISGKNGLHSNPMKGVINTKAKADAVEKHINRNIPLLYMHMLKPAQYVKNALTKKRRKETSLISNSNEADTKLHGSCLIFTPVFLREFAEPFDPGTFLYMEEDILWLRCKQHNIAMHYEPTILVRHEEDVSTDMKMRRDERRKQIQYLKNHKISLQVLRKYL